MGSPIGPAVLNRCCVVFIQEMPFPSVTIPVSGIVLPGVSFRNKHSFRALPRGIRCFFIFIDLFLTMVIRGIRFLSLFPHFRFLPRCVQRGVILPYPTYEYRFQCLTSSPTIVQFFFPSPVWISLCSSTWDPFCLLLSSVTFFSALILFLRVSR